jgi:hypothetical protein
MVAEHDISSAFGVGALLKAIGKGRKLDDDVGEALSRLFGVPVGHDGLSRVFQPGYPGIRVFAIEGRVAHDQAVEIVLVGVARDGAPVWWGSRSFCRGRGGALELHLEAEEIEQSHRSRNITVDLVQRELDLIALVGDGASSRVTIDAHGISSYVSALHGFVFADETEEGPPMRSARALDPGPDRRAMIEAARPIVERIAHRQNLGKIALEGALESVQRAKTPWDFLRATFPETPNPLAEGDDGEMGVGALGRELLLAREMPPWRAALYIDDGGSETHRLGEEYRRRKTTRSETRLAREIQDARELLVSSKRDMKTRGLKILGMIGPPWIQSEVKMLDDARDRRVAAVARQTFREVSGADLPDRLLSFADNTKNHPRHRGLAYRVLAEHFRTKLMHKVSLMRVNPDALIQRAILPLLADDPTDYGPNLASMLAANPANEGEAQRPGLSMMRLEIIERLTKLLDPRTLPALLGAFRARPTPPPAEMLALSRALVAFPDPRAHLALTEVARRLDRPAIP